MAQGTIRVFDPTPLKTEAERDRAAERVSLAGRRLAVVWNGKLGGDILLGRLSELLAGRVGLAGVETVGHKADTFVDLSPAEVARLAATCDAALVGTAD
jgi:hypothetical protein